MVFIHHKESIYVLSAVLHVPEQGSRGFSTLVPSCTGRSVKKQKKHYIMH